MEQTEPRTFEEFWPVYVRAHKNKTNRDLHFAGTSLAMACIAGSLLTGRRSLLLAAPVLGYGLAWVGHFFVEGNRPATFGHPLWSLRGDLIMWWKTANGTMGAEVEHVTTSNGVHDAPPESGPTHVEAPAPS